LRFSATFFPDYCHRNIDIISFFVYLFLWSKYDQNSALSVKENRMAYEYQLLIKNILQAPVAYNPDQEIVYRGNRRFTYKEFHERVGRLASALMSLGIGKGDTVAVMDWDSNRYLECYFAIPMIGAVLHTINVRLSGEQLIYTMDHAEDKLVLAHADFLPILSGIRSRIHSACDFVLLQDEPGPAPENFDFIGEYEPLLASAEPLAEFPDFDENTRATIFYTTGTTGLPKGVYFSHRQLVLHTVGITATLSSIAGGPGFNSGDVYMPITPMFHVHAWGIPYIATFLGIKQVYPGKYAPAVLGSLIANEGVTFSHCVPTILAMILKDPSTTNIDLSKWKVIIGGAALPKVLCAEALARGINVFSGYGMSETCPVVALTRLTAEDVARSTDEQIELRSRTGTPVALARIRVIDAHGNEVPSDDRTTGEITLRTPWLTESYYKDKTNTEKLWEGGWLHTQDVATRDAQGSVRITDRLKDVIKTGGEWLSSLEIEDIVASHPAVAENAVVGSYDGKWGEVPLACVVRKPGQENVSEHRIMEHVRGYIEKGRLAREAILLQVRFVDAIDKTSVGKANKLAMREKYALKA
jgi:fatty-acyl-CoA synthase